MWFPLCLTMSSVVKNKAVIYLAKKVSELSSHASTEWKIIKKEIPKNHQM